MTDILDSKKRYRNRIITQLQAESETGVAHAENVHSKRIIMPPQPKSGKKRSRPKSAVSQMDEETGFVVGDPVVYRVQNGAYMLTYNFKDLKEDLWRSTYTMLCLECATWFTEVENPAEYSISAEVGDEGTFHVHVYAHHSTRVDRLVAFYAFNNKLPRVDPNRARGAAALVACKRGHYYCQMRNKIGVKWHMTTWPVSDPKPEWFKRWYEAIHDDERGAKQKYLTRDGYREALLHYNLLTDAVDRNLRLHNRISKATFTLNKIELKAKALLAQKMPYRYPAVIWAWVQHYQVLRDRYEFLIVEGTSKKGKSKAIQALFEAPFIHSEEVNWSKGIGYDDEVHDAILFDDIRGFFKHILSHKTTFQANNELHSVQVTPSQMYTRDVYLHQKPLVVLWNNDEGYEPNENSWLVDNTFARIRVEEEMWCHNRLEVVQELITRESCLAKDDKRFVLPLIDWLRENAPSEDDVAMIKCASVDVQLRHAAFVAVEEGRA